VFGSFMLFLEKSDEGEVEKLVICTIVLGVVKHFVLLCNAKNVILGYVFLYFNIFLLCDFTSFHVFG
jgi:hypothetical protein